MTKEIEAMRSAVAAVEHEAIYKSNGPMVDSYVCTCGWTSKGYFDGEEYAYGDWNKHKDNITKAFTSPE